MCRTLTIFAVVMYVMVAVRERHAAAADGAPEPPVTPFIDSGNDLPDLEARAREARAREAQAREAQLGPERWYGWQILIADLAVLACVASVESAWCLAPYPFVGPALHLANGHRGRAIASIGFRVGMSMTAAALFAGPAPTRCRNDPDAFCGWEEFATGAALGAALAAFIDAAISFTHDPRPPVIEPRVSFGSGVFNLGVGGRF